MPFIMHRDFKALSNPVVNISCRSKDGLHARTSLKSCRKSKVGNSSKSQSSSFSTLEKAQQRPGSVEKRERREINSPGSPHRMNDPIHLARSDHSPHARSQRLGKLWPRRFPLPVCRSSALHFPALPIGSRRGCFHPSLKEPIQ